MHHRRLAPSALAVALAAASLPALPASADAPWTAPDSLAAPGAFSPTVTVDGAGRTLTTWQTGAGTAVGSRPPGGGLTATTMLPGARVAIARTGSDSALVVTRGALTNRSLHAFDVATTGRVRRDSVIARGAALDAAAAANRRGMAVVAWIARDGSVNARVRPRRGARFGPTRRLAPGHAAGVGAAVGPTGEAVVVWAGDDRRVLARARRGDGFGRPLALGRHDGRAVLAATYSGGRLHVAWASQDGGEQADRPQRVHAASRARGARRFTSDRVLHASSRPGALSPIGDLRLVALPAGGAAAAWTSPTQAAGSVHVALARGGTFGPVRRLDPDGVLDDLAATSRGGLVVTWTRAPAVRVFAAVRSAGGGFGAPEAVSAPGGSGSAVTTTAAGRVTAAWTTTAGEVQLSDRR